MEASTLKPVESNYLDMHDIQPDALTAKKLFDSGHSYIDPLFYLLSYFDIFQE